jgi:hypothetical protein
VISPDGTRVAFVAFEVGVGNIDIWTMGLDGSGTSRLTQEAGPDTSPDWQPIPACTISGTGGGEDLVGTDGDDVICALGGDDAVHGGFGEDLIYGGRGTDLPRDKTARTSCSARAETRPDGGPAYDVLDGGGGRRLRPGADGAFRRL